MWRYLHRLLVLVPLFLSCNGAFGGPLSDVGVVLMHGKLGMPSNLLFGVASDFEAAGATVSAPEMPWSQRRIYDASYDDAMREIDATIAELRRAGKTKIIVGGMSLGANAAIGYAARRSDIDAVIAIAPGHFPESPVFVSQTARSREIAQRLAAGGRDDKQEFADLNQGAILEVTATPRVYLSYLDPDGAASFRKNANAMNAIPVFMAVGDGDRVFRFARSQLFEPAAKHPKSRYVEVEADHRRTADAARNFLRAWIAQVVSP